MVQGSISRRNVLKGAALLVAGAGIAPVALSGCSDSAGSVAASNQASATKADSGSRVDPKDPRADAIFTNGNIYTVDAAYPWATAMVVRDGLLVYVGDDEGAKFYQGPVTDLKGQFVMPGIIDSHVHIAWGSESVTVDYTDFISGSNKAEVIDYIKQSIKENPEIKEYKFLMQVASLAGEKLMRADLDEICPDKPLLIVEMEQHSRWMNTLEMAAEHIGENDPDISPGLSYCERDENGRINGRIFEFCGMKNTYTDFPESVYDEGFTKIAEKWQKWGVVAAFDAGQPSNDKSIATFFNYLKKKDEKGELPQYIEGCFYTYDPKHLDHAIETLQGYDKDYATEHLRARTMKIMLDGTANGHTAAMFQDYADQPGNGGTLLDTETLTKFIVQLNEAGIDLHVHDIGDRAIATVLDAVEAAQTQLGDKFKIRVTCAHVEFIRLEDIGRFKKLGVFVNMTPAWFGGNAYGSLDALVKLVGKERSEATHRAETFWNTGANVAFSSDSISLSITNPWNPYVGIETGVTHQTPPFMEGPIAFPEETRGEVFPNNEEKLALAQMIAGYTINGARQMKLDDKIGSLEAGKDASFLVFENSLFDIDPHQINKQEPKEFYICGKLQGK